MGKAETLKQERRRWREPSLPEQVSTAEHYGIDTLLYCEDPGPYVTTGSIRTQERSSGRAAIGGSAGTVGRAR